MDRTEIAKRVGNYITNATFSDTQVDDNLLLFNEGVLDSMGLVGLISFIEEEFNIQISDTDLVEENFESINTITNFIASRLNEGFPSNT